MKELWVLVNQDESKGVPCRTKEEADRMAERLNALKEQAVIDECGPFQMFHMVNAAEVKALRALLREAVDSIEEWAGYADDYYRKKHDFAGELARYRAALGENVT